VEPPVSLPLDAEAVYISECLLQPVALAERVDASDREQIAHRVPNRTKCVVGQRMEVPGSAWNFGWPLAVRLCDVDGGVDGLGVEEGGEDGELAVALDSSVLGFGGEHAGGGPAKPHVGGVAVTG
jgi:hypothetical protein